MSMKTYKDNFSNQEMFDLQQMFSWMRIGSIVPNDNIRQNERFIGSFSISCKRKRYFEN